jgi:hypothetical protein
MRLLTTLLLATLLLTLSACEKDIKEARTPSTPPATALAQR